MKYPGWVCTLGLPPLEDPGHSVWVQYVVGVTVGKNLNVDNRWDDLVLSVGTPMK